VGPPRFCRRGRLPKEDVVTDATDRAAQEDVSPAQGEQEARDRTVLVAENDDGVRRLAQTILERAGYRVQVVVDGRAAVEAYRAAPAGIDVVFLDMNMPLLSGLDALAEMRRIEPAVRAVLTSGGQVEPTSLPPDTRFLAKPFRPADLLAAVAAALGQTP
jgi:CheY-like chemotaxis protein